VRDERLNRLLTGADQHGQLASLPKVVGRHRRLTVQSAVEIFPILGQAPASRPMQPATVDLWELTSIRKDLIDPLIAEHRGLVKTTGDGLQGNRVKRFVTKG
jgi:hypothetical protein